jgi:hypothetical protein
MNRRKVGVVDWVEILVKSDGAATGEASQDIAVAGDAPSSGQAGLMDPIEKLRLKQTLPEHIEAIVGDHRSIGPEQRFQNGVRESRS